MLEVKDVQHNHVCVLNPDGLLFQGSINTRGPYISALRSPASACKAKTGSGLKQSDLMKNKTGRVPPRAIGVREPEVRP